MREAKTGATARKILKTQKSAMGWTLFLSNRLLGERLTRRKVLGVLLVFCGVVILTR